MSSLFGERATAELVGKLRLLTACELCKKPCSETFFAVECGHYTCKNCVCQEKDACSKCDVRGMVLRAHYLDPISETLLKLKDLLCGEQPLKPNGLKRRADQDLMTPTTKAIKSSPAASNLKSPTIDAIFARKSKPSNVGSPVTPRPLGIPSNATASVVKGLEEVIHASVDPSKSIRDSPTVRTVTDRKQCGCSCDKPGFALLPKSSDSGVQVSNSVLTLDVAVHAKPSMKDSQMQTDESMCSLQKPVSRSAGVQTEKPHIRVKRFFETAVQTDELMDKLCGELCPEAKSLTSTQAGSENQTVHAQPISLDMSPIKQMYRSDSSNKTPSKRENKDTLDSLDYRTMDLREAGDDARGKEIPPPKQVTPEPDSLDYLPSDLFNELDKAHKSAPSKKNESQPEQRDTLESFFKSSDEASIPETEPPSNFASPLKATKSKRAVARSESDSPLRLTEKKKKTVIMSDEDEPLIKTRFEGTDQRNRSLKTKSSTTVKESRAMRKSQSRIAKALPTFSSDEDDADPLPMDTEDMRNLEKEIENLDREMEDSKTCGKSRF